MAFFDPTVCCICWREAVWPDAPVTAAVLQEAVIIELLFYELCCSDVMLLYWCGFLLIAIEMAALLYYWMVCTPPGMDSSRFTFSLSFRSKSYWIILNCFSWSSCCFFEKFGSTRDKSRFGIRGGTPEPLAAGRYLAPAV